MPRVTSREVARRANVSQTTVSFVLNNVDKANISEETRARVLQAATELGYVIDSAAQSLARGKSMNIGLVFVRPHQQLFNDSYVANFISGINSAVQTDGYRLLIEIVDENADTSAYARLARGNQVSGMTVLLYNANEEDLAAIQSTVNDGFPLVIASAPLGIDAYTVSIDHYNGIRRAIAHLATLGHQKIGSITYGPMERVQQRFDWYREALAENNIPFDSDLIRIGEFDPATGYTAMTSLIESGNLPTALFAMNDAMAIGALAAIQEAGLRVPEDIAVIGYDDIPLARFTTPPLTTMHAPEIEQAKCAGEMLLSLINGEIPRQREITLQSELVIRGSCPDLPLR